MGVITIFITRTCCAGSDHATYRVGYTLFIVNENKNEDFDW